MNQRHFKNADIGLKYHEKPKPGQVKIVNDGKSVLVKFQIESESLEAVDRIHKNFMSALAETMEY